MGLDLDPEVQSALIQKAGELTIDGIASLVRGAVERREGRNLAAMEKTQALAALRRENAEFEMDSTDTVAQEGIDEANRAIARGAAQAGAGEVDEGDDGA